MSTDLETQLAALGRHLNETVGHVGVGEIVEQSDRSASPHSDLESAEVIELGGNVDRRPRWLLAVAAILIVVLVGSFAVSRSRDDSRRHGDVPTPSTELPVTTPPPTTTVVPPASAASFVPTGGLQTVHAGNTDCFHCPAVLLPDGRVLVVAGASVIQAFDPTTGTFSIVGGLDGDYGGARGALLADGRVIFAGGSGALAIFDPSTGLARTIRAEDPARNTFQIPVVLSEGRVLLFGDSGVSELDLANGGLTAIANMATPMRVGISTVVPLLDGNVLVLGHPEIGGDLVAEIFNPKRGTFAPTGRSLSTMGSPNATRLLDGRVLVVGSRSESGYLDTAEVYDPVSGTFSAAGPLSDQSGSVLASMALLPDGRVLIIFASSRGVVEVATTDIFEPATGTFTAGPRTGRPRLGATAITLKDGRVLLIGSYSGNGARIPGDGPWSAEIFQPNGPQMRHG